MLHEGREGSCSRLSPGATSRSLRTRPPLGDATGPATLGIAGCALRHWDRDGAGLTVSSPSWDLLRPTRGSRDRPDLHAGQAPAA